MIHHSPVVDSLTRREFVPGDPLSPCPVGRYEVRGDGGCAQSPTCSSQPGATGSTYSAVSVAHQTRHHLLVQQICVDMRRPNGEPDLEETLPVPPVCRFEPHRCAAGLQDT
ncbi:hypothetical protein CSUB01_07431 [Colletotrichum sublineola]|uniref:Uncharacterized protein n=1 Tax=Colletotrichum sublineola TaxID=1173701 RepID=A0A066X7W3_COLSU|nr:hypothetical protein CSUB01_07431 [Colletotrichum sublineola]